MVIIIQGTTNLVEAHACERKSKGGHKDRRWRNVALIRQKIEGLDGFRWDVDAI